jgi:hypothetical protein
MLTSEEKEILDTLKEHMDDEQKEALDEMSDAEKKELVKEAKKEIEKARKEYNPDSTKGRFKMIREMSYGAFLREYGGKSFIGASVLWLVLRMTRTKAGCLTLLVIVAVIAIAIARAANP